MNHSVCEGVLISVALSFDLAAHPKDPWELILEWRWSLA
jgi:hypothetical protein